jgi:hypothetical protein
MIAVYVLISIIMIWYGSRPTEPTPPPEPDQDDHKQVEELINLTLAVAAEFLVLFLVFLWNR